MFLLFYREKADHLVHDLLEGTVFSSDYTAHGASQPQKSSTEDGGEEAPGVVLRDSAPAAAYTATVEPTQIDTNNKTSVNDTESGEPVNDTTTSTTSSKTTSQKTNQVKMRNSKEGGSEESRTKKFYRRLSFSHKDKAKANLQSRRSREAEDFEILNTSELIMTTMTASMTTASTTTTTASVTKTTSSQATVTSLHGSSSSHHHGTPKTFAGLFTLNRRASKRETPKGNE